MSRSLKDCDEFGFWHGIQTPKQRCKFCDKNFLKKNVLRHEKRCKKGKKDELSNT